MSLHVREVQVQYEGTTVFAALHLVRTKEGLVPRVRISQRKRSSEKVLGFASLNRALELIRYPREEISEGLRNAIEKELQNVVGEIVADLE